MILGTLAVKFTQSISHLKSSINKTISTRIDYKITSTRMHYKTTSTRIITTIIHRICDEKVKRVLL